MRGIHTNWRVAVYYPGNISIIRFKYETLLNFNHNHDEGNAFPAHYDLSDTVRVEAEEEGKIEVIDHTSYLSFFYTGKILRE